MDYARQQISMILSPHTLTPFKPGPATQCYTDHLTIGDLGVGAIHFGEAEVDVPTIADYHLLIACQAGSAHIEVNRRQFVLSESKALIIAPGSHMHARFSADCEQFFVRIPRVSLRAHAPTEHVEFAPEVDLDSPTLRPFLSHLELITSNVATVDLLKVNTMIKTEYERMLVYMLLAGQAHRFGEGDTAKVAPRSVRLAEAFIRANYDSALTLDEIAAAANVPARTLLASFQRFRSTSPMRYLRDVRLDEARQQLKGSSHLSIASIALKAGFNHFGRFAYAYAERFHEKPSDTLRANRQAAVD